MFCAPGQALPPPPPCFGAAPPRGTPPKLSVPFRPDTARLRQGCKGRWCGPGGGGSSDQGKNFMPGQSSSGATFGKKILRSIPGSRSWNAMPMYAADVMGAFAPVQLAGGRRPDMRIIRHAAQDDQSQQAPHRSRPTINEVELGKLMGAIGKIGSNTNQLARQANAGSWPDSRLLHEACADVRWMRDAVMRALGIIPPPEPDGRPAPAARV